MRKIAKQQEQDGAEIDLTPMLDVVFIMLIFFIVTASFVKEAGIDITRPPAATAACLLTSFLGSLGSGAASVGCLG